MDEEPEPPDLFSVYELPLVENVCRQVLRGVVRTTNFSLAHVTMNPGDSSLLHKHRKTKEGYFILQGVGVLHFGKKGYDIQRGDFISIPVGTPHRLKNLGSKALEHLVVSVPPFDAADVQVVRDRTESRGIERLNRNKEIVEASDGASVQELNSLEERQRTGVGLAVGTLPAGKASREHYHKETDEVYYVVSGRGSVVLDGKKYGVKKGTVVLVPKGVTHHLESNGRKIEVFCISSPCYSEGDFFLGSGR